MEQRLGKIVGTDPAVTIVTKIGTDLVGMPKRKRFDAAYLRSACERSGERLGRSKIDVLLLHNPAEQTLAVDEVWGVLAELKAEGKIGAWGVSAGSAAVARGAIARGAQVLELAYNPILRRGPREPRALGGAGGHTGALGARARPALRTMVGDQGVSRHRLPRGALDRRTIACPPQAPVGAVEHRRRGGRRACAAVALRFVLANPLVSSAVLGPEEPRAARSAGARGRAGPGVPVAELDTPFEGPTLAPGGLPVSRSDLDRLASIARDAGQGILRIYQSDFQVDYKGPGDPVTDADREANTLICARLEREFPGAAIVAEESASEHYASYREHGRVFFVDPLDGTREYVAKNGQFVVMIGLLIDDIASLGVVYAPTTDTLWCGEPGGLPHRCRRQRAPDPSEQRRGPRTGAGSPSRARAVPKHSSKSCSRSRRAT